eukprot:gnl/TRDRNA2_/TRDRNA2_158771_c2_seq2.p1 gnl/TRDRNA2_/TRDRNA2_158771_c2~~gnl/TRDRNA2_/TRDRNA2_158771_c2_seq2.p1  ORF type:complete len:319 (-),score=30.48 gnl/TRDRNA2_/TRDRNA2_158771_c2_seq2:64-1020(-)
MCVSMCGYNGQLHRRSRAFTSAAADPTRIPSTSTSSAVAPTTVALATSEIGLTGQILTADSAPASAFVGKEDEARLSAASRQAIAIVLDWAAKPASWWDERRHLHAGGFGQIVSITKDLTESEPRLFIGEGTFEDVTLAEINLCTTAHEGSLKEHFDPTIERFQTLHAWNVEPSHRGVVVKTVTKPVLLGLISAREVVSVCGFKTLSDGRRVEAGLGFYSPELEPYVSGSPHLEALRALPPSKGMVRAVDRVTGFLMEPLDTAAASGGPGRIRVRYVIRSEAGGGLPKWVSDKGQALSLVSWFSAAHKELVSLRSLRS